MGRKARRFKSLALAWRTNARDLHGMRASQIQSLILNQLVRNVGGTRQRWRRTLGEIIVYSMDTHPHCNWDVRTSGPAADVFAVEKAVDVARMAHPHVTRD